MTIPEADRQFGCAPSTTYRLQTRNDLNETVEDGRRPGRPRMTTPAWDRVMRRQCLRERSRPVTRRDRGAGRNHGHASAPPQSAVALKRVTFSVGEGHFQCWKGSPSVLERVIFSVGEGHLQCRGGPLSVLERATFSVREGHFKCWRGSPSVLEAFTRSHNNASAYRQNRMV